MAITISLSPSKGNFDTFQAFVDNSDDPVIDTPGGAGDWHGDAQKVEISVKGVRGSSFACSVTGTLTNGTAISHKTNHTLDKKGNFDEHL